MKEITFSKPNPYMGDNGVTTSHDIVDTNIFEYQIQEYGNRLTIMRNAMKAAYYLAWGNLGKTMRNKLLSHPGL